MKILLIEDDENKTEAICNFVSEFYPNFPVLKCRSYSSGLKAIFRESGISFVLLDMSMPTYDRSPTESGGDFLNLAGELILKEIVRKNVITKVVVITGYDDFAGKPLKDLSAELNLKYSQVYLDTIYYGASQSDWKSKLKILLDGGCK